MIEAALACAILALVYSIPDLLRKK
jgi:hypothetical protein